jgi:hypothetical protein
MRRDSAARRQQQRGSTKKQAVCRQRCE